MSVQRAPSTWHLEAWVQGSALLTASTDHLTFLRIGLSFCQMGMGAFPPGVLESNDGMYLVVSCSTVIDLYLCHPYFE